MKYALTIFLLLSGTAFAQQKYNFHLGLSYNDRLEKVNGSDRINVTTTIYNVGFGANLNNGLYVGIKYYQYNEAWGDNRDEDKVVSGPGLSLGYFHNSGFTIIGSYLWGPEKEYPNASGGKQVYSGGTGTVIDIAYLIQNGSYAIGPMITQANISYKKIKTSAGEVDVTGSTEDTHLFPYLVVFFYL
jgi:hypothetical protein